MQKNSKNQKGFVALFTVLIVSVILAMALGIASISLKEIVLSSSASEGSKAFYAADGGIECALYYERTTAPAAIQPWSSCNGNTFDQSEFVATSDSESDEVYTFLLSLGANNELCADVTIKRGLSGTGYTTLIESKGSNVPCDVENNPKKVERSIRVTY